MANRWGNKGNRDRLYFSGLQNHYRRWLKPWNKTLAPWKKSYDQPGQHIKKQRHYFTNKGPSSQIYGCSNNHVWMWKLDYKASWAPKNWWLLNCGVGEDSWESLELQRDQTSQSKGNQSWIFIGRIDAEAPILWLPDVKSWFIGKDLDARKDSGQEEKGTTEDEMVGWHHHSKDMSLSKPGSWQWTGRPGMLQSIGSQRVGHYWAIELNWNDAEAPTFWSPDVKNWLIWKDSNAGKDWGQEEKGVTEDEMAGWLHQLNGREFE